MNDENNRLIEIDGVSKKGYEWKQTKLKRETFKAAGNNTEARNQSQRLKAIEEKYQLIADKTGIKAQYERMAIVKGKSVDNSAKSGIIKERDFASRNLAMSLRKPRTYILSDSEIKVLKDDIKAIKADESIFRFNSGYQTSYVDEFDIINIRGDVLPDKNSKNPRDLMSSRAVIAHEYYGHRPYRGTKLSKGAWNDEFRASYMAAKNTPNLTDEDRRYLVLDALERAKEGGITIKNNEFIRRTIYGY